MLRSDFTGHRYGRLVVIAHAGKNRHGHSLWLCKCECGNEKVLNSVAFRHGNTKSCGCLQSENRTKHGMHGSPEYMTWNSMIQRCENPHSKAYNHYGGRGITVCDRWKDFDNFFQDMGERPSPKYSLDRIDVNGNYEPANCRWTTQQEQVRNTRIPTTNTSGVKGVSFDSQRGKWHAYIHCNDKKINLGRFDTIEEAIEARKHGELTHWERGVSFVAI